MPIVLVHSASQSAVATSLPVQPVCSSNPDSSAHNRTVQMHGIDCTVSIARSQSDCLVQVPEAPPDLASNRTAPMLAKRSNPLTMS